MARMIQVRNVPERLHRELKKRARAEGKTLTGYVEAILAREVSVPPRRSIQERIAGRSPVNLGSPAAELLRAEREARSS
jgi:plasmid stability protein